MNGRTFSSSLLQALSSKQTPNGVQNLSPSNNSPQSVTNLGPIFKISLEIPIMTPEKLYPTASMADSLPYDVEFDLRLVGCELIQISGQLLKLPQTAMATAQVLFHRYYYTKSFVKNPMEYYAMASIFLSAKIQECPRRIRDVMNVFNHIKQVRTGKVIRPMQVDNTYAEVKNQVNKAERKILKELGFCIHFKHPHKIIFIYLRAMAMNDPKIIQKAWNYMNDSYRTDIFLRYSPENIVCACIYLSARELQIPLPLNPPWWTVFDADEESLKAISVRILHLYSHKTRSQEELEKICHQTNERLTEEKRRARQVAAEASANQLKKQIEISKTSEIKEENLIATITDQKKNNTESISKANEVVASILTNKISSVNTVSNTTTSSTDISVKSSKPSPSKATEQSTVTTHYHQHSMSRHSSFTNNNPNYFNNYHNNHPPQQHHHHHVPPAHIPPPHAHLGPHPPPPYYYNDPYYNPYNEPDYYNENGYYEGNGGGFKRNKSAPYISSSHHRDYDEYPSDMSVAQKRGHLELPGSKDRIKSYHRDDYVKSKLSRRDRSRSHSPSYARSRSRTPPKRYNQEKLKERKNHNKRHDESRSRSRSIGSVESDKSGKHHKKKKSSSSSHRHHKNNDDRERSKESKHYHSNKEREKDSKKIDSRRH